MLFLYDCSTILPLVRLIRHGIIPLIQVGIPLILIVLGMLDLGKAVMASKEDEIKSAQKLLIKRCIYAVAIFFVVLIVNLVFSLLSTAGTDSQGNDIGTQGMTWSQCWSEAK